MGFVSLFFVWLVVVLPLNYTRLLYHGFPIEPRKMTPRKQLHRGRQLWWRGEDSNLRRLSRQIYSLITLAAREPLLDMQAAYFDRTAPACQRSTGSKIAERGEIRRCNPGAPGRESPAARPRPH